MPALRVQIPQVGSIGGGVACALPLATYLITKHSISRLCTVAYFSMTVCSIAAPIAVSLTRGQLFLTIPVIVVGYMIVGFSFGISLVTKAVAMALAVDEDQVWAANKSEISKFKFNSRELELMNLLGLVLGCIEAKIRK